ncbi:hypothetical protein F5148DRAFT_1160894 [Russula earlei]|uniref:Uncharacterized protein n=1 Tax=Russula earlei TaxID=71964 RepID=A0ACC0ULW7_9AGAM|nr:hypothetical protein F5148DRAFT_1160894 [Russula earlei]
MPLPLFAFLPCPSFLRACGPAPLPLPSEDPRPRCFLLLRHWMSASVPPYRHQARPQMTSSRVCAVYDRDRDHGMAQAATVSVPAHVDQCSKLPPYAMVQSPHSTLGWQEMCVFSRA